MKQLLPIILVIHLTTALLTTENEGKEDASLHKNALQSVLSAKRIRRQIEDPALRAIYEENDDSHYLDLPIGDLFGVGVEMAGEPNESDKHFGQPKSWTTEKPGVIEASTPNVEDDYDCPDEAVQQAGRSSEPGKGLTNIAPSDYEYMDGDEILDFGDGRNPMKPLQSGKPVLNTKRYLDTTGHHRRNNEDTTRNTGRRAVVDGTEDYDSLDYRDYRLPDDYYDIPEVRTRRKSHKRQRKDRKRKWDKKDRFQENSYGYDSVHDHHDHEMPKVPMQGVSDYDSYDHLGDPRGHYTDFEGYSPRRRHNKGKRRRGRKFHGPNYSQIYDDDSDESFEDYRDLSWPVFRGGRRNYHHYGRSRSPAYFNQKPYLPSQRRSYIPAGRTAYGSRDDGPPGTNMGMGPGDFIETAPPVRTTTVRGIIEEVQTTEAALSKNSKDFVERDSVASSGRKNDLLPGFTPPEGITYAIHDLFAQPSLPSNPDQNVPNNDFQHPVDIDTTETLGLNVPTTPTTRKPEEPIFTIDRRIQTNHLDTTFGVQTGGVETLQPSVSRNRKVGDGLGLAEPAHSSYDQGLLSSASKTPNYNFEYPVDMDPIQDRRIGGQQGRPRMPPTSPDYDYDDQLERIAHVPPPPNPYHRRVPDFLARTIPRYPYDRSDIFDPDTAQPIPRHYTPPSPFADQPYDPLDFIRHRPQMPYYSGVVFPSAQTPWNPNRNFRSGYHSHRPNVRPNFMAGSTGYNLDPMFPDHVGYGLRMPYEDRDYAYIDGSDMGIKLPSLPDDYHTDY